MKKKKPSITLALICIIIISVFIGWNIFGPLVQEPEGKYFYIYTGSNFKIVKAGLIKQKILSGTFFFDQLSKYSKYDKNVKPGRYKINDGMSVFSLLRMLRSGKQAPVNLVLIKLRTKEDLAKKLSEHFEFDQTSAINFLSDKDTLARYDLDTNLVLTAIIPNTYVMQWNSPVEKVFKNLFYQQQKFWNAKRLEKCSEHNLTKIQTYILASLVEEETNKNSDKGKIASVYINRLNAHMKLASDPTIKFAMKDFSLKRIYYKYLSFPSPYNTYLHTGLPPGPICTPSVRTIDAVLNAPATDYLFFVAKPDFSGYSNFASSYIEHNKYAKEYQHALDSILTLKSNRNKP